MSRHIALVLSLVTLTVQSTLASQCNRRESFQLPHPPIEWDVALSCDEAWIFIGVQSISGAPGTVTIYRHVGNDWVLFQTISGPTSSFGSAVLVDGDVAFVGAPYESDVVASAGAVYELRFDGTEWAIGTRLTAGTPHAWAMFGWSLAKEADTLLVGAPAYSYADSGQLEGAAHVFRRNGDRWTEDDVPSLDAPYQFAAGASLAIAGDYAIVGAPLKWGQMGLTGRALVLQYDGAHWTDVQTLTSHDGQLDNDFGVAVGISGDWIAVGAPLDDVGPFLPWGSVDLFHNIAGQWTLETTLTESGPGAANYFGSSILLAADTLLIDSPLSGPNSSGRAYVYRGMAGGWYEEQELAPSDDDLVYAGFGKRLALNRDLVLVGRSGGGKHAYGFLPVANALSGGKGWPGLDGVPELTLQTPPLIGTRVDIFIGNSARSHTTAAMLLGTKAALIPTPLGGTLYLLPIATLFYSIPLGGLSFSRMIPDDPLLDGAVLYAQVLEVDAFASRGVSFSSVLRATFGTLTCDP